jgi:hypothetical protein
MALASLYGYGGVGFRLLKRRRRASLGQSVIRDRVQRECILALEQGNLVACSLGPLDPGFLPEGMRELHLTNLIGRTGILPGTIELLRTLARKLKRLEIEAIVMDAQRRRL